LHAVKHLAPAIRMAHMRPARFALHALILLTAACATSGARYAGESRVRTVLHVENRGQADVVVYLADGNTPFRLGVVGGLDRALFAIPNQVASMGVRLLVLDRGSGARHATDLVVPGAGGVLALTVQPLLLASDVSVLSYGPLER
jgi:hypothetical protein